MNARHLRNLLIALVAITAFAGPTLAAKKQDRPNVVWLVSEDNSTHFMRLFDKTGPRTPAIEKLAEHGLVYEHAFSCAPVCSAARSTLATGCFGPRIFTHFHREEVVVPMPEDLQMIHGYLADAGYYTANKKTTTTPRRCAKPAIVPRASASGTWAASRFRCRSITAST